MDLILNGILLISVLGGSALITRWFAHHMYRRCQNCGTLNARRRSHCRGCGQEL